MSARIGSPSDDGSGAPPSAPFAGRRIHFIGAGGAGMSAYARACAALGATVSGSDRQASGYSEALARDQVMTVVIGHSPANVPAGADVEVVASSAIAQDNPELAEARRRNLRCRSRAELLGELSALKRTVAIAGTHGKTTTAAMCLHAFRAAGLDPSWLIGAAPGAGIANGGWSDGEWLIIEADESDRSLLALRLEIAVLTNVELDHADAFASLAELRELFASFLERAPKAAICSRPELLALRRGDALAYAPEQLELSSSGAHFCFGEVRVQLRVPGAHNACNAAGALAAAKLAGADLKLAAAGLASFSGAARRLQLLGSSGAGALIYDDYAHHPSEVQATLAAARPIAEERGGRLVAAFQPHLYSRTALFADRFGQALAAADVVACLDVYPARERAQDHPGVSGLLVAAAAAQAARGRTVYWLPRQSEALQVLAGALHARDVCVVMGAGDCDRLAHALASAGLQKEPASERDRVAATAQSEPR